METPAVQGMAPWLKAGLQAPRISVGQEGSLRSLRIARRRLNAGRRLSSTVACRRSDTGKKLRPRVTCQRGDAGWRPSPRMTSCRADAGWRLSSRVWTLTGDRVRGILVGVVACGYNALAHRH